MKTKKVNRYYCDFCNKGGCAAGHMKKHELHCTMNPDRICQMCQVAGNYEPTKLVDLIAILKDEKLAHIIPNSTGDYDKLPRALRDASNDCPACILAAIRQSGQTGIFDWDYRENVKKFWLDLHSSENEGM